MKKVFVTLLAIGAVAAFTSCGKEYKCCYQDADGETVEFGGKGCTTTEKMKESEIKDLEDTMNATLTSTGSDYTYKCAE